MHPLRLASPKILKVDGSTLDLIPVLDSEWIKAKIYILQNYNDDGVRDLSTAFHEGGHFLDFSYQRNALMYPLSSSYAETHSTTMESFLTDREFLLAHGKTRSGTPIPEASVDLFLKNKRLDDLGVFRNMVMKSIYDLELWDYDYEAGPRTFVERAEEVAARIETRTEFVLWPQDLPLKSFYGYFVTGHFYGGSVTYFGYVLAQVAAGLMSDSLYEKLKALTGRESLYKQPLLGSILSEGIYRQGFKEAFPKSVEKFTGKAFSPANFTGSMIERVQDIMAELSEA